MKLRIATLATVLLACFALSATGCSKKDDDKKKNDTAKKKKDGDKKDTAKKDGDKKGTTAAKPSGDTKKPEAADGKVDADALKGMHEVADKMIAKIKEICACKDKACASKGSMEMMAISKEGQKYSKKGKKAPEEIMNKIKPAMTQMAECMKKLK